MNYQVIRQCTRNRWI